jgi:hypothetical protein
MNNAHQLSFSNKYLTLKYCSKVKHESLINNNDNKNSISIYNLNDESKFIEECHQIIKTDNTKKFVKLKMKLKS